MFFDLRDRSPGPFADLGVCEILCEQEGDFFFASGQTNWAIGWCDIGVIGGFAMPGREASLRRESALFFGG